MRRVFGIACLTLGVLAFSGPALATPVSFQGGVFDVVLSDLGGDVYRFVYTADFTAWDDTTSDDYITAIEFGFPGWNDMDSVSLVSDTAPGDWTVVQGNASTNNCNEQTNQFKICAQENALLLSASTEDDQIYTWTIDVAYNSIGELGALTSDQNTIEAMFYELDCKTNNRTGAVTCEPKQAGKLLGKTDYGTTSSTTSSTSSTSTSTNSTDTPSGVVPEPTIMTLLGAALMLAGRRLRRRSN